MADLTVAAELAWRIAALEAQRNAAGSITSDHLLIGLLSLDKLLEPAAGLPHDERAAVNADQVVVTRILDGLGLDPAALRRAVRQRVPAGRASGAHPLQRSPACLAIFARAEELAQPRPDGACGVLDLLTALLERPSPALRGTIGDLDGLRRRVSEARLPAPITTPEPAVPTPPERVAVKEPPPPGVPPPAPIPGAPTVPPMLLRFARDLTADAEAGRLPPVIGRDDELLQVVRVLRRRTKNGPVLVGEAGVGKTAVVEGLAQRIADGTVLPGRRIVALSMSSLVAGTSYRGQFEERLGEILAALHAHPEIILFLDEIHTIVGAGDADGRLDAASILKPALARGEIACIGATTLDEYRRYVERDPALERRFQPVLVAEPSRSDTLAMLQGLRSELERHHGVRIDPEALGTAIELTARYVPNRRLPDKAVDALDEACARTGLPGLSEQPAPSPDAGSTIPVVTCEAVTAVIAAWTGQPLGRPNPSDAGRIADLEAQLAERVVGQESAIRQVAERVRLARTGLTERDRPAAVLLLVGPSGVGKTELALALADALATGPAESPFRLVLSEYAEERHLARLIGSPAATGREQEGRLTGPLRRGPGAVVVLDDVNRAHPDVIDGLLPLLATGRLTDGHGCAVDGRQAIIVLTAGLPVDGAARRSVGFQPSPSAARDRDALLAELRAVFPERLLATVDDIVPLRPLGESDLLEVARRQIRALAERLHLQHALELTVSDEALALLARHAAAAHAGAREVERALDRLVLEPLGRELLAGHIQPGDRLRAEPHGDGLAVIREHGTV